jgi:hypothetical protein
MASPNNPKSSEQLIREHSKARVLHQKPLSAIDEHIRGMRPLRDGDVIEQMVRQYR